MKRIYSFEILSQEILNKARERGYGVCVYHGVNSKASTEYILVLAGNTSIYITKREIGLLVFGLDGGDPYYMGDADDVDDIMVLFDMERRCEDCENISMLV